MLIKLPHRFVRRSGFKTAQFGAAVSSQMELEKERERQIERKTERPQLVNTLGPLYNCPSVPLLLKQIR